MTDTTSTRTTGTPSGRATADDGLAPRTLSMPETARLLGVSEWLVKRAVREGALPSLRLGRRVLIPRDALQEWLSSARTGEQRVA